VSGYGIVFTAEQDYSTLRLTEEQTDGGSPTKVLKQ
jgi:hypothetical protein